jgi:hypothetical protein
MIAGIAGQLRSGTNGDGSIFGAVVQVDPVSGLPTPLVETLAAWASPRGQMAASLTVTLQLGTLAIELYSAATTAPTPTRLGMCKPTNAITALTPVNAASP